MRQAEAFYGALMLFVFSWYLMSDMMSAQAIDLTGNLWAVEGVDRRGVSWNETTLQFTSQALVDDETHELSGYFDWYSESNEFGREQFTGTLFSDNTMELQGHALEQIPGSGGPHGIVTASYFAILDESGNSFLGDWSGIGIPGDFSAIRLIDTQVPGDFDLDNDVDGSDFLSWQRGAHSSSDLAAWRTNYGSSLLPIPATPMTSASAVPEPTTLGMIGSMAVIFCLTGRLSARRCSA